MGKNNFGLDPLKSILNRDMEEKGIVILELSCRTTAELPPPELPDYGKPRVPLDWRGWNPAGFRTV